MEFTPEEIARQRELASKATPRPWDAIDNIDKFIDGLRGNIHGCTRIGRVDGVTVLEAIVDGVNLDVTIDDLEYLLLAVNTHEAALDTIAQQQAEIGRLREALNDAGNAIAKVVACCTYGSEEQAKFGAYGISHEAFTLIDAFIRKHGDLLNTLEGGE